MKILMICHYMLPHKGDIEIVVDKLTREFAKRGHKIKIVTSQVIGSMMYERESNREIFRVKSIDPLRSLGVHYPIFAPNIFTLLKRFVQWADIVHVHGMLYQNSLIALLLSHIINRPSILTEHAGFVTYKNPLLNLFQTFSVHSLGKLAILWSKKVIVHDIIVMKILSSMMHIRTNKLIYIPLGVDTNLFRPVSTEEKKALRQQLGWNQHPKVLFVGNFVARKRINLLLEALDDNFDLVLCGEGFPSTLRTSDHLLIYPAMEHEDLVKLYQASDIFVVPSKVETFCIVAYEAMACGLPVIMTQDIQYLTIAQSGLVTFVPANPESLKKAILDLLDNESRRKELGQAGAEWVHKYFSWNYCIEQHLALYEQLLSK
jgi:glycosyltransferase involved in cell wall biosynthesis